MKIKLVFSMTAMVAVASYGAIPSFEDDFETLYEGGDQFTTATNGWQASGAAAYVTNGLGVANSKAAFMGPAVTLTNTLSASADATLKVWTDFQIKPSLGVPVGDLATNASSFLCYVRTNGVMYVAQASGWQICSNDVWGNAVAPLTNNTYARLSIFQDYSTSNQAVFLNDQLIAQDLHFTGSPGTYRRLVIQNPVNNCLLDNVWIHTNVVGLTSNLNADTEGLADAAELQRYGYARRVLYVSSDATNLVPLFSSLTNAVAAWRPRDTIHVIAGSYASENVVITSNVVFEGDAFTVNSLTVASGVSLTLTQNVACTTLWLTGQVAMANGASLTSSTAQVAGNLSVSDAGAFVVTSMNVTGAGLVSFTSAQLIASAAGVVMNGTFAISNTWGSASLVSMPLPFSDDFESYADDTQVANLKFRGWYASAGTVMVTNGVYQAGSKSIVFPDGTVLSNSINSAATKIWTDTYIRLSLGTTPLAPATDRSSFLAYANTNGYLVVATNGGGWLVCSNQLNNTLATQIVNTAFTRLTVCQDLSVTPNQFAVFVAGNLVAQGVSSPTSFNRYRSFVADNSHGRDYAYVDDVLIATTIPPELMSDLDGDGMADAWEINTYGSTHFPRGTVYKFR